MPFNLEPEIHFTLQKREAQNSYFARFFEPELNPFHVIALEPACIVSGITGKFNMADEVAHVVRLAISSRVLLLFVQVNM